MATAHVSDGMTPPRSSGTPSPDRRNTERSGRPVSGTRESAGLSVMELLVEEHLEVPNDVGGESLSHAVGMEPELLRGHRRVAFQRALGGADHRRERGRLLCQESLSTEAALHVRRHSLPFRTALVSPIISPSDQGRRTPPSARYGSFWRDADDRPYAFLSVHPC